MIDAIVCTWKLMSLDKKSTTFQDVNETSELYKCYSCKGNNEQCKYYITTTDQTDVIFTKYYGDTNYNK